MVLIQFYLRKFTIFFSYFCSMNKTFIRNTHRCAVGLGSNCNAAENLKKVRTALENLFPDIRWSDVRQTTPHSMGPAADFLNQVGSFTTCMPADAITAQFKSLEKTLGRTPEGKAAGIITADVDLLYYDETILKPADLKRDYVQMGLADLKQHVTR